MNDRDFEHFWNELKAFLMKYRREKSRGDKDERYCVALSIDDILKKMKEIEEKS